MYCMKQREGFAVLTSVVLLCIAGIVFTTNMAATQLIDNQIVANYYRNNEAFLHAESGINLILSRIDESSTILASLPLTYHPVGSNFTVQIQRVNKNRVEISSLGVSQDGSAEHKIGLQVYHELSFNIPKAALSSNGKVNLDSTATINDGCEGVSAANCKSAGNIAQYLLVSNPATETVEIEGCTGMILGVNQIDPAVFYSDISDNSFLRIGEEKSITDMYGNTVTETIRWPAEQPVGSEFYGLAAATDISPVTLFESTFGVTRQAGIMALQTSADVVTIDMTIAGAMSCSRQLADIDEQISTIYIKGDCDIEQNDASYSVTSENKRFTIGSVDNPKLVFIEGGTFITQPNTGASVIGMLYFLPGQHEVVDESGEAVLVEDSVIDMGGIRVNGAILSDYSCSHNGYDKTDNKGTKQHFLARYDKTVLNQLYNNTGSVAIDSGYSLIEGSWRDF